MVVIMRPGFSPAELDEAVKAMEAGGVKVMVSQGSETTILGAEGNAAGLDQEKLSLLPGVERVMRVTEPFKKANRKYHPDDTVVDVGGGCIIGGERLAVIAGPCSVESQAQIIEIAQAVKGAGAAALRGGAYKAPHLALRLPGAGPGRHPPAPGGQGGHGPAHRHGNHVHRQRGDVRAVRGRDSGGCAEHAEL